jgi:hypothetical protein
MPGDLRVLLMVTGKNFGVRDADGRKLGRS